MHAGVLFLPITRAGQQRFEPPYVCVSGSVKIDLSSRFLVAVTPYSHGNAPGRRRGRRAACLLGFCGSLLVLGGQSRFSFLGRLKMLRDQCLS